MARSLGQLWPAGCTLTLLPAPFRQAHEVKLHGALVSQSPHKGIVSFRRDPQHPLAIRGPGSEAFDAPSRGVRAGVLRFAHSSIISNRLLRLARVYMKREARLSRFFSNAQVIISPPGESRFAYRRRADRGLHFDPSPGSAQFLLLASPAPRLGFRPHLRRIPPITTSRSFAMMMSPPPQ